MTVDRPDPVRGKIAEISRNLYDAWDAAKTRANVWRAAAASLEDEIRDIIGDAGVIVADGKPVAYRRIVHHSKWTQDAIVRAPKNGADDELRRLFP